MASYGTTTNRILGLVGNAAALRTYTYDGNGNILTDTRPGEVFAFTYNKRNRPVPVTRNSVAYATYGYNANEQLVSRSTAAPGGPLGKVHYIHDLEGHVIAEADGATWATTREYIWLDDLPIGLVSSGTLYLVHSDHLARPIRVTDATKATVWQATYTPFGEPQAISGTLALDMRFPGQLFQIETGLSYNWHRHYDPVTGRYTQPDPLRFVDGPSVYAYVGSSPFMKTDRDGRVGIGGAVVGGGFNFAWQLSRNLAKGQDWKTALMCVDYLDVAVSAGLGALGLGVMGNVWKGNYAAAAVGAGVGSYVKTWMNPYKVGRPAGPASGYESSLLDGLFQ